MDTRLPPLPPVPAPKSATVTVDRQTLDRVLLAAHGHLVTLRELAPSIEDRPLLSWEQDAIEEAARLQDDITMLRRSLR
jgi:hypothetical protein